MSIHTTIHKDGVAVHFAVCDECGLKEGPLFTGVAHSESALNVAFPAAWLRQRELGSRVVSDYCQRCAVAPEYRP